MHKVALCSHIFERNGIVVGSIRVLCDTDVAYIPNSRIANTQCLLCGIGKQKSPREGGITQNFDCIIFVRNIVLKTYLIFTFCLNVLFWLQLLSQPFWFNIRSFTVSKLANGFPIVLKTHSVDLRCLIVFYYCDCMYAEDLCDRSCELLLLVMV